MFFLLLTTFSSVYAGSYWDEVSDVDDCKVLAEQGDANAQKSLGVMYHKGKGVLLSLL
jgi:TPR repeat protein